jgi:uncharacterized damage-inducible protein DinB
MLTSTIVQLVDEVRADEHARPEPPHDNAEAPTLLGFLDYQRVTLQLKCHGLTDEQLRVVLPPSPITLGGLLKHLACVEDSWFTEVVAGQPLPEPWASVDFEADPDWTFHSAVADSGDALRALWAERVNRSREIVAARLSSGEDAALGQTHPVLYWGDQERVSLRWVLAHMIEEYARHNGHADLIRESIDGQTGD